MNEKRTSTEPSREGECEASLRRGFDELAERALRAGWDEREIARALLRIAGANMLRLDGEHTSDADMATVRRTVQ